MFYLVRLFGGYATIVCQSSTEDEKLTTLTTYLTDNNIYLSSWDDRQNFRLRGIHCATQTNPDEYSVWQMIQPPDWEGDPEDGFQPNDIYKLYWADWSGGRIHIPRIIPLSNPQYLEDWIEEEKAD